MEKKKAKSGLSLAHKIIDDEKQTKRLAKHVQRFLLWYQLSGDIFESTMELTDHYEIYSMSINHKSLINVRLEYLSLFLSMYPTPLHSKSSKARDLFNEFGEELTKLRHKYKKCDYKHFYYKIGDLVRLTDNMVKEAGVQELDWYSMYDCPRCWRSRHNFDLTKSPVLHTLVQRHHATLAHVAFLVGLDITCDCSMTIAELNDAGLKEQT